MIHLVQYLHIFPNLLVLPEAKKVSGSFDYILQDLAHMELETYIIPSIFSII